MKTSIVCFGEMLWDVLPTGKQPGGAPMNVAVHLKNLGHDPKMISRVGNDDLGHELVAFVAEKGLDTTYIQTGRTHLTGIVKANVSDKNEVTYKIVQPVAWDYIQYSDEIGEAVAQADMFVYGSLAARSATSVATLDQLLVKAKTKVFDVNLRAPFYDQEIVEPLMRQADVVKMNANELELISSWYHSEPDERKSMLFMVETFGLKTLCVTKGEEGAVLFMDGEFYQSAGFEVEVQDTIGSGDSFLAALLTSLSEGKAPADCVRFACGMGSLVATYRGATPEVTAEDVYSFLQTHE